jgi:hypothetical protein
MALWHFWRTRVTVEAIVEGKSSSQQRRPARADAGTPAPRVVGEFEIHERGIALRMRIERWPSPTELAEDEAPAEAGYGHGV